MSFRQVAANDRRLGSLIILVYSGVHEYGSTHSVRINTVLISDGVILRYHSFAARRAVGLLNW